MPTKRTVFDNRSPDEQKWTGLTLKSNIKFIHNLIFKTDENVRIDGLLQYFRMIEEAKLRGMRIYDITGSAFHPNDDEIHNVKFMISNSHDVGAELAIWVTKWRGIVNGTNYS